MFAQVFVTPAFHWGIRGTLHIRHVLLKGKTTLAKTEANLEVKKLQFSSPSLRADTWKKQIPIDSHVKNVNITPDMNKLTARLK